MLPFKMKLLLVFGTRPEAIKMAPLISALDDAFTVEVCVTAQHREMLDQVLDSFQITPAYDLDLMRPGQDLFDLTSRVLLSMRDVLQKAQPDCILVHGDTTTSMTAALAAFYLQIPVGHVEAGLRTHKTWAPFPEELNRQVTARMASFHFAPTERARMNLLQENIKPETIYVTGNTVIDALLAVLQKVRGKELSPSLWPVRRLWDTNRKVILVTGHRRENFGPGFEGICRALREIATLRPEVEIVYPVHLNPNVQKPVSRILEGIDNVHLIEPQDYCSFVQLMDRSYLILTDSGGVQEEAPTLGKPVLVMREVTERPEAVHAGTVRLVGASQENIVRESLLILDDRSIYEKMSQAHNPYGDGLACKRINNILKKQLLGRSNYGPGEEPKNNQDLNKNCPPGFCTAGPKNKKYRPAD